MKSVEAYSMLFEKMDRSEIQLCQYLNGASRNERVREFFTIISILGNGRFWYGLIVLLPLLYGYSGLITGLVMAGVGVLGLFVCKYLKNHFVRQRPYLSSSTILMGTPPLDQFSFPSGHTLHAVSFTLVCLYAFPQLAFLLIPFTALVALSRIILGLHYLTDAIAGALIGTVLALLGIWVIDLSGLLLY